MWWNEIVDLNNRYWSYRIASALGLATAVGIFMGGCWLIPSLGGWFLITGVVTGIMVFWKFLNASLTALNNRYADMQRQQREATWEHWSEWRRRTGN